ncbi:hypothetical protein V1498_05460 [Peribacillus sp. SCS-26]|uniref:hypothetical protein n=1 Tax=Paraperibacillus marinus TaxID=3115295 RepID=UPI003906BF99
MNMFDLVVTVALGSTMDTILLFSPVTFLELQPSSYLYSCKYAAAWLQVRSRRFAKVINGEPQLLFYSGHYLEGALKVERVKMEEMRQAV